MDSFAHTVEVEVNWPTQMNNETFFFSPIKKKVKIHCFFLGKKKKKVFPQFKYLETSLINIRKVQPI